MKIHDLARAACVDVAGVVRVLQQIRTPSVEMLVAAMNCTAEPDAEYDLADGALERAGLKSGAASLHYADLILDWRAMVDAVLATVHEQPESPAGKPDPAGAPTGNRD